MTSRKLPSASCSVLVTGASGFVGSAVVDRLLADGVDVVGAVRRPVVANWEVCSPTLGAENADWTSILVGKSVVIHTAARAHILNDQANDPIADFRSVNTAGTIRLAEQSAEKGIRRFIFLSSIGVNGVQSRRPFKETDTPAPLEPYAVSKLAAEEALMQLAKKTGMEVVILRPPLVYGPGAPGNFGRLLRALSYGVPLPLGGITRNRRTLVSLNNLVDLTIRCITHPSAANQVFLVGDSEDLSTTDLLRRLGRVLEVPQYLFPIPLWMLTAMATMLGKRSQIEKLCGTLQVDISKACELLGWSPPFSVDEGLRYTALHWRGAGDPHVSN